MVDYAKTSYLDGYVINDTDMDALHIGVQGQGVVAKLGGELAAACSGFDTTIVWSKGMVRALKDGSWCETFVASGSLDLLSYQDASDYKKVIVFVDPFASMSDVNPARMLAAEGTASAPYPSNMTGRYTVAPAPPDYQSSPLDSSCVPIAEIWLPPTGFDISSSCITDRRIFVPYIYGSSTVGGRCLFKTSKMNEKTYNWSRSGNLTYPAFDFNNTTLESEASMYFYLSDSAWDSCEALLPSINLVYSNLNIVWKSSNPETIEDVVITLYASDPDTGVTKSFTEYNNVINFCEDGGMADLWHTTSIVKSACSMSPGTSYGDWGDIRSIKISAKALTGEDAEIYVDNIKLTPLRSSDEYDVRGGVTFVLDGNANLQALAALAATASAFNNIRGVVCVNPASMSQADIVAAKYLQTEGWDIINRGLWNASLAHPTASSDFDKCFTEIVGGRIALENMGFDGAKHVAYPDANYNPTVCMIAEKYCGFGRRLGYDSLSSNNWPPDDIKLLRAKMTDDPSMSTASMLSMMSAGRVSDEWTIFVCESWSSNMTWAATKSIVLGYGMMTFGEAWNRLGNNLNEYTERVFPIADIAKGADREVFTIVNPSNATFTHGLVAGNGPVNTVTVSTNLTQSECPRNAVITCTNVSYPGGSVVIYGTDVFGKSITETVSIVPGTYASGSTPWLYIEKYVIPSGVSSADSVGIGIGDWFGLSKPFWHWSDVIKITKNGVDQGQITGSTSVQFPFNAVRFTTCTAGETYSVHYRYAAPDYIPDKRRNGYAY